jgi:4'-phosphopantetheinyl transferase
LDYLFKRRSSLRSGLMIVRPLDTNAVRMRWLFLSAAKTEHLSFWRQMLDEDELRRADRFHFPVDREAFTAGHALTRAMLSEVTGKPSTRWRFVEGKYGRPEIASSCETGGLRFNVSHTRGLVACAVAYRSVGVDVESADHMPDPRIADTVFAPEEALVLKSAPPALQRVLFFRLWTLKEAFIKATGEGLRRPLNSFSFTLDPARIRFHSERAGAALSDVPAKWQFAEHRLSPHQHLALAVQHGESGPMRLDVRAAQPEEIA